jgi:hypothetical protein
MRRASAKFGPRLLSQEQKELRLSISLEMRDCASSDSGFLRSLITGDESWVYGYDPETKMQEFSLENTELATSKESASC